MSRTPSCLDGRRTMALLVVGAVLVTCPEAARVAIASWDSSEANLDYAVRVEPGARGTEETSVPEAHRQVPWMPEGWFRSAARSAGVLIDVQHAGGRRPRFQTKEATEAVDSPAVRAGVWTR